MNLRSGITGTGFAALIAAGLGLVCPAALADDKVAAATPPAPAKQLDLRTPDIAKLYTRKQLETLIARMEAEALEEVEVEGERNIPATPRVWPGIFAPLWAVANPTQAWRIIAPLPPDQTRGMQFARVNVTDAYMLEPAGTIQLDY